MKVLIVAGGTAGHIIPALEVAKELQKIDKKIEILFVTTRSRKDLEIIKNSGFRIKKIFSGKWRRYFSLKNFTDFFLNIFGFFESLFIILNFKPDIIFSKGGYVSLPVCLAGEIFRKKIIIHESDLVLGLANRLCLPFSSKLAVSYPLEFYKKINPQKLVFTGNPIRKLSIKKKLNSQIDKKTLLVIGGSQGARKINYTILEILDELLDKVNIIHLVGSLDFEKVKNKKEELLKEKKDNYYIFPNVFDLEEYNRILNESDIVISRAGAGAISELAFMMKPVIFIPLPGHQEKNAEFLEENKAAIVINNDDLTSNILKEKILMLLDNPELMNELEKNISNFSHPEASVVLAKEIINLGSK